MPQAFQARKFFIPKTDPKQEVYKPVPYYFGTLSTQDAADQIAEESSLTKGDVLNVLDRYQRYVIKNLQKGYKVELLETSGPRIAETGLKYVHNDTCYPAHFW